MLVSVLIDTRVQIPDVLSKITGERFSVFADSRPARPQENAAPAVPVTQRVKPAPSNHVGAATRLRGLRRPLSLSPLLSRPDFLEQFRFTEKKKHS